LNVSGIVSRGVNEASIAGGRILRRGLQSLLLVMAVAEGSGRISARSFGSFCLLQTGAARPSATMGEPYHCRITRSDWHPQVSATSKAFEPKWNHFADLTPSNVLHGNHFRKDWQRRVKSVF
jgi:hypothetical protein